MPPQQQQQEQRFPLPDLSAAPQIKTRFKSQSEAVVALKQQQRASCMENREYEEKSDRAIDGPLKTDSN